VRFWRMERATSPSLQTRAGVVRVGVAFLLAVALVSVAIRYPQVLSDLGDAASRNSALSFSDREIAGGNSVLPDQSAAYAARGRIPEDETYRVAFGPGFARGTSLTRPYAESYYLYFLMPRRQAADAPWVLCHGCDVAELGSRAEVVWEGPESVSIVRTER
jgi:hypothetical protein